MCSGEKQDSTGGYTTTHAMAYCAEGGEEGLNERARKAVPKYTTSVSAEAVFDLRVKLAVLVANPNVVPHYIPLRMIWYYF